VCFYIYIWSGVFSWIRILCLDILSEKARTVLSVFEHTDKLQKKGCWPLAPSAMYTVSASLHPLEQWETLFTSPCCCYLFAVGFPTFHWDGGRWSHALVFINRSLELLLLEKHWLPIWAHMLTKNWHPCLHFVSAPLLRVSPSVTLDTRNNRTDG
jgi:hypothetical protein